MACHPPVFTLLAHPRSTLTILPFIKSLQMATSHSPTPCHLEYWNTSTTTTTYTHSHTLLFKHLSENETQPGPCTPTDSVFWNLTPFHLSRPLQVSFTPGGPRTPYSGVTQKADLAQRRYFTVPVGPPACYHTAFLYTFLVSESVTKECQLYNTMYKAPQRT